MGALADIRAALDAFDLGSLAEWAWGRYLEGATLEQILREVYDRPEFKAVYPEYEVLASKGRAYSVAELQAYRKAVVGLFRQYGIPESFYDQPEDLARFAANEVSVAEISRRVAAAAEAVYQTPPVVRAELERLYGVTPGEVIAFWLDERRAEPIIRQQWTAAQIAGQARTTTFGVLTQDEAERLAALGVDSQQAQRGFAELARSRELFSALDRGETDIGREVQLGAAFGGDAAAQQQIEQRRARRLAEFSEGGGFAVSREGIAGVA